MQFLYDSWSDICASKAISVIVVAMKKKHEYSAEGFIGEEAIVISKLGPLNYAQYMVKVHGELWSANSVDDLKPGDKVKILSTNRLILVVAKASAEQP